MNSLENIEKKIDELKNNNSIKKFGIRDKSIHPNLISYPDKKNVDKKIVQNYIDLKILYYEKLLSSKEIIINNINNINNEENLGKKNKDYIKLILSYIIFLKLSSKEEDIAKYKKNLIFFKKFIANIINLEDDINKKIPLFEKYYNIYFFKNIKDDSDTKKDLLEKTVLVDFLNTKNKLNYYKNVSPDMERIIKEYLECFDEETKAQKLKEFFGDLKKEGLNKITSSLPINSSIVVSKKQNANLKLLSRQNVEIPSYVGEFLGKNIEEQKEYLRSGAKNVANILKYINNYTNENEEIKKFAKNLKLKPFSFFTDKNEELIKKINPDILLLPRYPVPEKGRRLNLTKSTSNLEAHNIFIDFLNENKSGSFSFSKKITFLISYADYSFFYGDFKVKSDFNMETIKKKFGSSRFSNSFRCGLLNKKQYSVYSLEKEEISESDVVFLSFNASVIQPTLKSDTYLDVYNGIIKVFGDGDCYYRAVITSLLISIRYGGYESDNILKWLKIVANAFVETEAFFYFSTNIRELSYPDFLAGFFEYDQIIIYSIRKIVAKGVYDMYIENSQSGMIFRELIKEDQTYCGGSIQNYCKIILTDKKWAQGPLIDYRILPKILGTKIVCSIDNQNSIVHVYEIIDGIIDAPLNIHHINGNHYDVFSFTDGLSETRKKYNSLKDFFKKKYLEKSLEKHSLHASKNILEKYSLTKEQLDNIFFIMKANGGWIRNKNSQKYKALEKIINESMLNRRYKNILTNEYLRGSEKKLINKPISELQNYEKTYNIFYKNIPNKNKLSVNQKIGLIDMLEIKNQSQRSMLILKKIGKEIKDPKKMGEILSQLSYKDIENFKKYVNNSVLENKNIKKYLNKPATSAKSSSSSAAGGISGSKKISLREQKIPNSSVDKKNKFLTQPEAEVEYATRLSILPIDKQNKIEKNKIINSLETTNEIKTELKIKILGKELTIEEARELLKKIEETSWDIYINSFNKKVQENIRKKIKNKK
jgi:hypothetical protein